MSVIVNGLVKKKEKKDLGFFFLFCCASELVDHPHAHFYIHPSSSTHTQTRARRSGGYLVSFPLRVHQNFAYMYKPRTRSRHNRCDVDDDRARTHEYSIVHICSLRACARRLISRGIEGYVNGARDRCTCALNGGIQYIADPRASPEEYCAFDRLSLNVCGASKKVHSSTNTLTADCVLCIFRTAAVCFAYPPICDANTTGSGALRARVRAHIGSHMHKGTPRGVIVCLCSGYACDMARADWAVCGSVS